MEYEPYAQGFRDCFGAAADSMTTATSSTAMTSATGTWSRCTSIARLCPRPVTCNGCAGDSPQENYLGQDLESSNYLNALANRRKPYAFSTNRMGRQGPVGNAVNHDVEFVTNGHAHNYKRFRVQLRRVANCRRCAAARGRNGRQEP